ncbi:hypothetical protein [Ancylobacter sp. G4_0304]|uniref:hypothetical protein n=1 Tax=Ancylobacter sp. G4_0304 TaxID=3114289 RepID=UPI0039C6EA69
MPDLAVIVPGVYNSKPVKSKATEQDPCGLESTKQNIVMRAGAMVEEGGTE